MTTPSIGAKDGVSGFAFATFKRFEFLDIQQKFALARLEDLHDDLSLLEYPLTGACCEREEHGLAPWEHLRTGSHFIILETHEQFRFSSAFGNAHDAFSALSK